ncbi:MAG: alpha/beta fold hydrolase [Acidimicrobiia bacterium]|nr:alpha/beta fold hydrolase [Acidimicrobiia bacterium]
MYADANGIRIHYRIDGRDDGPWVTFLTGIANDMRMWDGQVPYLADDFRILRLDSRGHGGTQATEGDYDFGTLIGDVLGLWDALGVERSHLVGLGLGGSTALGLAVDHSDRLLSLVACACRATMDPDLATIWPALVEAVQADGIESIAEPTVQRWFTDDFKAANPEALDSVRAQILATSRQGYLGSVAAFLTLDFGRQIDRIRVPMLFISGADDQRGGPPFVMDDLARVVPGARHVSVPDAGHICNIQNPDGFNEVLGAFLRQLVV